mmetsp:Transcript_73099/g.171805  ORF Transcript_73099/g.171805 Transcript_73099/m.171805 type:complete len:233 (-) Transcript_73099:713-1411(-)
MKVVGILVDLETRRLFAQILNFEQVDLNLGLDVLLYFLHLLGSSFFRCQLSRLVSVVVGLLPSGHLFADMSLDLGGVLGGLGSENLHEVGNLDLGLWGGGETTSHQLLLLQLALHAVASSKLLPFLLGEEHRHGGRCLLVGRFQWDRVLHQVGHFLLLQIDHGLSRRVVRNVRVRPVRQHRLVPPLHVGHRFELAFDQRVFGSSSKRGQVGVGRRVEHREPLQTHFLGGLAL